MKKIVALLMVFVLVFSLAACSSDNTDTEKDNDTKVENSAYSTDTDPQLLIELADGNGYQLSIYGSSEPANMFAVTATFDDNGVHTGDESVQYTK